MSDRRLANLRAALGALIIAAHIPAVMAVHAQPRLDASGLQACTSVAQLIPQLQRRTLPNAQARQQLMVIYDMARTSSTPSLREIASAQLGHIASADDALLLVLAEQFRAACR